MPLFETTISIDHKEVAEIVMKNWNIKLGKLLKASQNHTFQAFSPDEQQKFSVRVTPDPHKKHLQRIQDELQFVNYCIKAELKHLVSPIAPQTSEEKLFLVEGNLIIAVFQWAKGSPLNFMEFRWMKDKKVITAWGRFFGQMHQISRKFSQQRPETVKRIQNWDQIHCSILAGVKLDPADIAVIDDPHHFGVIHGDLNCSNIHYVDDGDFLSVFDTDQVQRCFYLFDVAQACVALPMLQQGGLPVAGTPVEGVDQKFYIEAMIAGYESTGEKVDVERLHRMIDIKKQLYIRFAKQAFKEGNVPKDMEPFLKHILDKFQGKWKTDQ